MAIQHDGWSVVAQYRKCGKDGCKACADGRGHGPYYYGTKTVNGRRVSHYFGKNAPGEDVQSDSQDIVVALRAELEDLRQENTRLHARVEELQSQLVTTTKSSPDKSEDGEETPVKPLAAAEPQVMPRGSRDSLVVDNTHELTRAQVEDIWREETIGIDADQDVLNEAHESFVRGLFRGTQDEHTRIHTGSGRRPYVCPFRTSGRGAHRTFADPERLVRTAVPWLVNTVGSRMQKGAQLQRKADDRATQHRQRYERMTTAELTQLHERMAASVQAGSNLGWTLTLAELEEQFGFIEEVLSNRG